MEIAQPEKQSEKQSAESRLVHPPEQNAVAEFAKEFAWIEYEAESPGVPYDPELIERVLALSLRPEAKKILENGRHEYYQIIGKLVSHLDARKSGFLASLCGKYREMILDIFSNEQVCLVNIEKTLKKINSLKLENDELPDYGLVGLNTLRELSLESLRKNKNAEKSIRIAADFVNESKESLESDYPLEKWQLLRIFQRNPSLSADKLLKILKSRNETAKERSGLILHHLEFGRINVSGKGVEYLGRKYDLGEENKPGYFVQRLTPKGDIGIFDNDNKLQKFFNLGNLSGDETVVKPRINEFSYETLFIGSEDETGNERAEKEKCLKEFRENYFDLYNGDFFQKTGVRFNNLNFREQGWFLIHYKSAGEEEKEDLLEFAKQYGEDGIKSFLSLEFERENGNRIMEIGKKLGDDNARMIFNHLSRLADYVDQNNEELGKLFFEDSQVVSEKTFLCVRRELLRKAHETIISFAESLSTKENIKDDKIGKLLSDLKKNKTEIGLFHSLLKTIKVAGEKIDFEMVKGLDLSEKAIGEDIAESEKQEILEIARENYFGDIFKDNHEAAQRVVDELEGELFGIDGLKNQRTYALKYQGKIIAFCRFKPIDGKPDELYAGSLNVFKDLRGLSIGGYFVRATTGKEAKNYILRATTRVDNVANESYKKCGWKIDEEDPFEKNGVKYFNMTMNRRKK